MILYADRGVGSSPITVDSDVKNELFSLEVLPNPVSSANCPIQPLKQCPKVVILPRSAVGNCRQLSA